MGHDTTSRESYFGGQGNDSKQSTNPQRQNQQQHQQHTNSADDSAAPAVRGESVSSDKDVRIMLERPADQNYMDYDVADDNQWDIE